MITYSSYHSYLRGESEFVDTYLLLEMLDDNMERAVASFMELNEVEDGEIYEISESQRKSPEYIRRIIMSEIDGKEPETIKGLDKDIRNALIKKLVNEKYISKSALERATGISRGTIIRICNKM